VLILQFSEYLFSVTQMADQEEQEQDDPIVVVPLPTVAEIGITNVILLERGAIHLLKNLSVMMTNRSDVLLGSVDEDGRPVSVYVIGTAHLSESSCEDVKKVRSPA
jgi:hypothetical protein